MKGKYSADDIKSLDGRSHVRMRPGLCLYFTSEEIKTKMDKLAFLIEDITK